MDFRRCAWLFLVFGKFVLRAIVPIMRSESLAVRLPEGPITNNRLYCYYLFPSSIYLLCCNNLNRLENHPFSFTAFIGDRVTIFSLDSFQVAFYYKKIYNFLKVSCIDKFFCFFKL